MVDDHVFPVRALVDTGAEVNIIRKGVIPENFLQKDSHPLTLRGANETKIKGGNLCIRGTCTMEGKAVVSNYVWEARHSRGIFTGLSFPGKR